MIRVLGATPHPASLAPSIREPLLGYASRGFCLSHCRGQPLCLFLPTSLLIRISFPDFGAHDLPSETEAQIEAIKLARSLRETRPELVGKGYSIFVIDDDDAAICVIPLDAAW